MDNNYLGSRIKALRKRKGISQEMLAELSGLSLRTVQRIENGETQPKAYSLQEIAKALAVSPDELMDWSIQEDPKFLTLLNLSALTFIFFPILGILLPFILWTSKKDKVTHANAVGATLINFQITWNLLLFILPTLFFVLSSVGLIGEVSLSKVLLLVLGLYAYNVLMIFINTIRLSNGKSLSYFPQIRLLK